MLQTPFFDPQRSYEDNYNQGPFGAFADGEIYKEGETPQAEFLGFKVNLPFGIAAGPLLNGKFVEAALDKGFDLPVYKTVRTRAYPCHPWPNVLGVKMEGDLTLARAAGGLVAATEYTEPLSITNSFGVPSFDPEFWQKDIAAAVAHARPGQVVIGSFQGTSRGDGDVTAYIADFVRAAKLLQAAGVKILEVNLSCPNEGTAHLVCFDIPRAEEIVGAIKNEIGSTPLIVKTAYFEDQNALRDFALRVGSQADALAAINTIPAEIRNEKGEQALPGAGRLRSGVCGHAIKWAGLAMTRRLKDLRAELNLKFAIVGVGGVTVPADYFEYRAAGADAVMSATGAMWNPQLAEEIKKRTA